MLNINLNGEGLSPLNGTFICVLNLKRAKIFGGVLSFALNIYLDIIVCTETNTVCTVKLIPSLLFKICILPRRLKSFGRLLENRSKNVANQEMFKRFLKTSWVIGAGLAASLSGVQWCAVGTRCITYSHGGGDATLSNSVAPRRHPSITLAPPPTNTTFK